MSQPYLDSEQEAQLNIFVFLGFGPVFGQSWAQERSPWPQLEKCYMNQRKLTREIDTEAPRKLKSGPESKSALSAPSRSAAMCPLNLGT